MTEVTAPDFKGAVAYAVNALGPRVENGQLKADSIEPSEMQLRFQFQIKQGHDDNGIYYLFPEAAEQVLNDLSTNDRGAFDLYSKIIASRLFRGQPLSFLMRVFAGLMVVQSIDPPRPSKKKSALFAVHCLIYSMAQFIVLKFNISATSNDHGPGLSASDAISAALAKLGHAKSPRAIKEILVGKTSADLRDHVREISDLAIEWRRDNPEQADEWDRILTDYLE